MGMTIDKTIEFFNGLKCGTLQAEDARDVAISTMQKYQKIQEIVRNADISSTIKSSLVFYKIKEVAEDDD